MSNMQLMKIGDYVLGVPNNKMFDVVTLKVDLRPAIECLKSQSAKAIKIEVQKPERHQCRNVTCRKTFASNRRRLTHQRKYHKAGL